MSGLGVDVNLLSKTVQTQTKFHLGLHCLPKYLFTSITHAVDHQFCVIVHRARGKDAILYGLLVYEMSSVNLFLKRQYNFENDIFANSPWPGGK